MVSNLIILMNGVYANVILFNILARLYNCRCVALNAHIHLEKQDSLYVWKIYDVYMHIVYLFVFTCMITLDLLLVLIYDVRYCVYNAV